MEVELYPSRFSALGHPQRLAVFRLLMRRYPDAVPATEIAHALGFKPNTLSAYLGTLTQAGLITQTREGTSRRYRIAMDEVRGTLDFLLEDCCRGRLDACSLLTQPPPAAEPTSKRNVLFICVGNSARSLFAEAILRDMAGDRFAAHSAGTAPYDAPNPDALALLRQKGHDISALRPKPLSHYQGDSAPQMDFIFTVCDRAANENCPAWPGQPVTGHFGTPDPVTATGGQAERALAFQQAYGLLWNRISLFVAGVSADRPRTQMLVDRIAATKELTP